MTPFNPFSHLVAYAYGTHADTISAACIGKPSACPMSAARRTFTGDDTDD